MLGWAILLAASLIWPAVTSAQTASPPLVLEAKIRLGQVSGRIDHLGIDVKRQRLLVAELGNNSLGVVDLAAGKVLRRISSLREPQGVAYVSSSDSVFVANAGDGSVRVLRAEDLTPDAHEIGLVDLATGSPRSLPTQGAGSNFPMAIDGDTHRVLVVFRSPPSLMALSSQDGRCRRQGRDLR